jgi:hypothetical protein
MTIDVPAQPNVGSVGERVLCLPKCPPLAFDGVSIGGPQIILVGGR